MESKTSTSSSSNLNLPNILVTGTPGVGKTTTCERVSKILPQMKHLNLSKLIVTESLHDGPDPEFKGTYIFNEDKILSRLEEPISQGGAMIDHHSADFIEDDDLDAIFVLRASNDSLYPRLEDRGYDTLKINENIESEIFGVVEEEIREIYPSSKICVLRSENDEQMDRNVAEIVKFCKKFMSQGTNK